MLRCGRGAVVLWVVETVRVLVAIVVDGWIVEGVPLGVEVPFVSGCGFNDGNGII